MLEGVELTRSVITSSDNESKGLWALGYLKCNGLITKLNDVSRMDISEKGVEVIVKKGLIKSICNEPIKVLWKTSPGIIFDSIRWLGSTPLFKATGGAHVAAIFSPEGERLFGAEDIGRHNAVDKVVGWALRENVDLSGVMLMTSGRMPSDMVTKTWAAGIGLMASISAASADGIKTARLANITLAGFVREERMNIYTDSEPKRIEYNS
jgi:FdhD protein